MVEFPGQTGGGRNPAMETHPYSSRLKESTTKAASARQRDAFPKAGSTTTPRIRSVPSRTSAVSGPNSNANGPKTNPKLPGPAQLA